MSEICMVCNEEIHLAYRDEVEGIPIHSQCFIKNMFAHEYPISVGCIACGLICSFIQNLIEIST